jgi:hypothetical protein
VVGGHQHLPVTSDDQALGPVEPVGEASDAVDLDQAVLRVQGRLEPGDAARLVAQHIAPAIRADGHVAQVADALGRRATEVPRGQQPESGARLRWRRELLDAPLG